VKNLLKKINGKHAQSVKEIIMATIFVILCQKKGRNDLIPLAIGFGLGVDVAMISALFSTL
jgi:hypothetical protein